MRIERDMVGSLELDENVYYGLQSVRAKENFHITGRKQSKRFTSSLAQIKKAAALVNCEHGNLPAHIRDAIVQACDEILAGQFADQFITDPIQGGAGTSYNMNMNEVVANRAIEILGGQKGDYTVVHPNDHVNMS
ncbi:MAG: aspartate ammonia-lyase, partial [Clostridia bacterium]|nr:aspartate ammonia-lyase [Clostridia bacterium]